MHSSTRHKISLLKQCAAASGRTASVTSHAQRASTCIAGSPPCSSMHSQEEVDGIVADLGKAGAMRNTTVVSAPHGCGLGERYAALCSALSMGEKVRDQGGHSFVVLDDISCMVGSRCSDMRACPCCHCLRRQTAFMANSIARNTVSNTAKVLLSEGFMRAQAQGPVAACMACMSSYLCCSHQSPDCSCHVLFFAQASPTTS